MKIKVAVLFGGKSTEHEISIISAIQAINYLDKTKYDVIPVYVTKDNIMYTGEEIGKIENYTNLPELLKKSQRVIFVKDEGKVKILKYPFKAFSKGLVDTVDIFFPIVHGTNTEDGTLQGYLKMFDLPYVGCDVLSSAVGMDKYVMKTVLKDNGIPVLDCKVFNSKEYDSDFEAVVSAVEQSFPYPVIVKPIDLGSSIGISKAKDRDSLIESFENAFQFAHKVLVEPAVQNLKEINCAVLGDYTDARASECEQPVNEDDILSFGDKYLGGSKGMTGLSRIIPADITDEQRDYIRTLAVKAFKVLGCNGVSRIDFMMNRETGEIWLNEINTIPGSLSFYLWEPIGTPYAKLLDEMITLALKRYREENALTFTFESNVLEGMSFGGAKGAKGAKGSKY